MIITIELGPQTPAVRKESVPLKYVAKTDCAKLVSQKRLRGPGRMKTKPDWLLMGGRVVRVGGDTVDSYYLTDLIISRKVR